MILQENSSNNAKDHVMVCLSPSQSNRKIIEEAAKLAKAFDADFTALYVKVSQEDSLKPSDQTRLQNNIGFAEDCGANIITVIGENIPFQIAEYARISGVTKIVIGHSNIRRYHFWDKPTLTEQLIANVPNIDICIIPDTKTNIKINRNKRLEEQIIPTWKDILITIAVLFSVTILGISFSRLGFTESNIITVYILGVLVNAILTKSHFCGFVSSFCSVLLFNYLFTEPRLTLHAYAPGYSVTFIIMLFAALLTGSLAYRLKDSAREASRAAFRTKVLFDTNQMLQKSKTNQDVLNVVANRVILLLDRDVIIYPVKDNLLGNGYAYTKDGQYKEIGFMDSVDSEAVKWVLLEKKRAGATTKVFPEAKGLYLAIRINDVVYGIIGIKNENKEISSFEYDILISILGEGALALKNLENEKAKEEADLMVHNEKLRANLLRSISHDLRTPLTSISGNASNLCNHYKQLDDETKEQIFSDIYDDSEWLIQLVENLMSVTRIENGEMKLNFAVEIINDVIEEAIKHIDRNKTKHDIIVESQEKIILAEIDAKLIIQVIINLVNNAIKYTQSGSEIRISYGTKGDTAYVCVADNGPGMSDQMKNQAFDMFYTGQNMVADSKRGMGLGLALCKAVVEAHGGSIVLEDNQPSGCCFTFYLKKGDVIINE